MSRPTIVVVDLQNEYLSTGKLPLHELAVAIENAVSIIGAARQQGAPVIYIRHEQPGAPFFVPGSYGVEIIPEVAPTSDETVVVKNHPNAFRETKLEQLLRDQGTDQVVILGAMSHMCIAATGRAASELGFETTVIHDACATMDLEHEGVTVSAGQVHAANMAALAFAYAKVISTEKFLTAQA